ncbi:SDR family oxidoreductase [Serratia fonticola]|uniref:SDR family oxidoreductase n=1 Tax=Serratia fonticola TaxID=47917 RepID=UPI0015C59272|nr:SDR family oxidoreductase [Serratia fonticola]NYA45445.1 SDR family oxidoreductase [Serratia fonticola]
MKNITASKVNLEGKVAIVTGASSGIGMALARKLAANGMNLVLHGRREERLRFLDEELGGLCWFAGDLTDPATPANLINAAIEKYGRLDFAINNAGINHTGSINEVDIDKICLMARINVEAAFRFTYAVLRYFLGKKSGHLIHTTSVMGYKVRENAGGYAGTKHAVEALCEALRLELAKSTVKVSCVAPGLVQTELHRDLIVHPSISRSVTRPLSADDVVKTIIWIMVQPAHINIPQVVVLPQDHQI